MRGAFKLIVLVLLCIGLIMPGTASSAQAKPKKGHDLGTYNAILIGISDYQSFPSLSTPVADVEALAALLKKEYGFDDVTVLTSKSEEKPTASNILKVIRDKAERLTAKDNLLIYYAGHGYLDKLTKKGYWIPIDGKEGDVSTWIKHEDITDVMGSDEVKIKSLILIADSCYSGSMMRSINIEAPSARADDDTLMNRILDSGGKKSRVIVSSGGNTPVPDTAQGTNHSLFAHYLLKGLEENKNRYLDMGLLLDKNIKPELEKRIGQTPRMSRLTTAVDENGMFVLTKIGIAERPPKADDKAEIERLKQLVQELVSKQANEKKQYESQLSDLKAKQDSLNEDLTRLHDTNKKNRKQIEELRKGQEAEKRQYEAKLSELKSKQVSLNSDLSKLDELERKNKADELRLQALLKEKDAMSSEKRAEMNQEIQRIGSLNKQIESQRKNLQQREQSLSEAEQNLKKTEAEMNAKVKEEEEKIAVLKSREKEIEEKARSAEEARKKIADEARLAELNKKKIEDETRAAELKKKELEEEIEKAKKQLTAMAGIYSNAKDGDGNGRFVVLGDVVFDKETNLMWLKDANRANMGREFEDAESWVNNLNVAGYSDWHIPSKEEWRTLIPETAKGIDGSLPDHPFRNVMITGQYWVGSSIVGSFGINLGHGKFNRLNKKNPGYVWPVRYATPEEIIKFKSQASLNQR